MLQCAVTVSLLLASVIAGYLVVGNPVLSWPMFTAHAAIIPNLSVETAEGWLPFEPYDLLPSHSLAMTRRELDLVLEFTRLSGNNVKGECVYYGNQSVEILHVVDSRVVESPCG
jgi:hypothetical protein